MSADPAVNIRPATPDDAPELARLRYEFRTELDPPAEMRLEFLKRCTEWMSEALGSGGPWLCWVALSREALVGTTWLQLIGKLPAPVIHRERHGYISSVYVVPTHRNLGIGSALLQACLTECDARGVDAVLLWPTDLSRPLYQRHGFAVRDDVLERR